MSMYKGFIEEIEQSKEHNDLYGRGFTDGLALYYLVKNDKCSDELREWLYSYIDEEYGEVIEVMQKYNLNDGDLYDWGKLIKLEDLDAIVDLWRDWEDED